MKNKETAITEKKGFWPWILRIGKKSKKDKEKEIVEAILNNLYTFSHAEIERRIARQIPAGMDDFDNVGGSSIKATTLGKMYDFYQNWEGNIIENQQDFRNIQRPNELNEKPEDKRIAKKPLEVLNELQTVPLPWNTDLKDLELKISVLKDKSALSNQHYAKEQIDQLCKRLNNRKRYADFVAFFSSFHNTTDDKIEELLAKYKLVMKTSELFIPSFPDDAIATMKEYTAKCKEISGETPVFYVIAEEKDFKTKEKKLDPILLAQSPFGFYWQILGAWDKEMLLLSEL